jgi:hypothetical protein
VSGIEVEQGAALEHREQRLPNSTTEIEEEVRIADGSLNLLFAFAHRLAAFERLKIEMAIKTHDRTYFIQPVECGEVKEIPENPCIRISATRRLHQFQPQYVVTDVFEAKGILQKPAPVAAALLVVYEGAVSENNSHR